MEKWKVCLTCTFLFLLAKAPAQVTFTPGNLVVYRVGSGVSTLTNAAVPVFLDEYTTAGVLVQSIPMPVAASGSNEILTAAGTGNTEGLTTLSTDGQYLVITGYSAPVGTTGVGGTPSATWPRTIGLIKYDATINTSTSLSDLSSGGFVRCAVTTNGTDIWAVGAGAASSTGGVRYTTVGSSSSTQLNSTGTGLLRCLYITGGQLYVSGNSSTPRIGPVGTGLPVTAGQTITNLPGLPETVTPGQFVLLDLNAGVAGPDVLYFTEDNTGIQKYSLVSGTWVSNGTVGASVDDYRGFTAKVSGTTVTIYSTKRGANTSMIKGGQLVSLTDAGGYNGTFSASPVVLANAVTNQTAFRGVVQTPVHNVLPIKLISFTADKINRDVKLNWSVGEATNFSHFEAERSMDGVAYSFAGRIDLKPTTNSNPAYHFTDAGILNNSSLHDKLYYRLKMVDKDGKVEYSKIVTVTGTEHMQGLITAYPDPFINEIFVKIVLARAEHVSLSLIDTRGKLIKSENVFLHPGENTVSLLPPLYLPKGTYLLRVNANDKLTFLRLIK